MAEDKSYRRVIYGASDDESPPTGCGSIGRSSLPRMPGAWVYVRGKVPTNAVDHPLFTCHLRSSPHTSVPTPHHRPRHASDGSRGGPRPQTDTWLHAGRAERLENHISLKEPFVEKKVARARRAHGRAPIRGRLVDVWS